MKPREELLVKGIVGVKRNNEDCRSMSPGLLSTPDHLSPGGVPRAKDVCYLGESPAGASRWLVVMPIRSCVSVILFPTGSYLS